MRDWHILTHGAHTFTADERFSVLHKEGSYDWVLQIKYVQQRDAGDYECQVKVQQGSRGFNDWINSGPNFRALSSSS